jgi:glycosyltransferase involved in cell wall biosynthesis
LVSANAEAFAEVLSKLCERREQLEHMAKIARRGAMAQFSDDRLTADIARLYQTLLLGTQSNNANLEARA